MPDFADFERLTMEDEHAIADCDLDYLAKTINDLRYNVWQEEQSKHLRWNADMRAIKRWHDAGGDELTWPDHADLVVWLLERLEKKDGQA